MSGKQPPPPFKAGDKRTRELARKGAEKSHEVRRMKRTLREWAEIFRDTPTKADPRMTMGGAVALKMYDAAMEGDVKAARLLAELQGEMEEQISIKEIPKMIDDI